MSVSHVLTDGAVPRLPPMLFGHIRWSKSLSAPVGDPATGFKVQSEEHTVSKFQVGAGGIEVAPGTGIWKPPIPVPCYVAPNEGDKHVVAFKVPELSRREMPRLRRVDRQLARIAPADDARLHAHRAYGVLRDPDEGAAPRLAGRRPHVPADADSPRRAGATTRAGARRTPPDGFASVTRRTGGKRKTPKGAAR